MHAARDPAAFEEFYRRHIDGVTRFVARRITDPHTVADITAEVFVAVLDRAAGYRPDRGSETAWLYGIARNVVSGEWRRLARESRANQRIAGRRLLEPEDVVRLEQRIDAEAEARRLLEALDGLPEGQRAVLELVTVDQMTVTEAAVALGIRPAAARVRLYRARRALRVAAERPEQSGRAAEADSVPLSYAGGEA